MLKFLWQTLPRKDSGPVYLGNSLGSARDENPVTPVPEVVDGPTCYASRVPQSLVNKQDAPGSGLC